MSPRVRRREGEHHLALNRPGGLGGNAPGCSTVWKPVRGGDTRQTADEEKKKKQEEREEASSAAGGEAVMAPKRQKKEPAAPRRGPGVHAVVL